VLSSTLGPGEVEAGARSAIFFRAYHGIRDNPAQDAHTSPFVERVDFPFGLRGIMEEGEADPRRRPSGR
jgi:hypothetical protein